ncbi:MAG: hypothetical protein ABJ092_14380 [Gillisia sp.]
MNKYYYEIEEILDYNPVSICNWIKSTSGIKLSELKVKDLVFQNGMPIMTGNGVYIFKENDIPIYVGNCVARNFVERIPAHFDVRHYGWFNSLLVTLIRRTYNRKIKEDKTDVNLSQSAELAFENLELVLINFSKYDKSAINRLEDYLKITLIPLNGFKHKKLKQNEIMVRDYIQYNQKEI